MEPVRVTVLTGTRAAPAVAFDTIIPVDLPAIFTGYGPLPAVTGVRDQSGSWDATGRTRIVELKGGGEMTEQLVRVEHPGVCAYEVVPVKGPLRLLVDRIEGRFEFNAADQGTVIAWTYAFVARPGRRPLALLLAPLWRRYATQVLARAAALADAAALSKR